MLVRAIDLDGIPAGIETAVAAVLDARDLADGLRLFAGRRAWRDLLSRLPDAPGRGGETEVVFYGSGDFHHVTAALVARHPGPLTVLHFDNHPDWVSVPRGMNCGAWVNRALELPCVTRVVTVGPASDDLVNPQLSFANLRAVESDRIRLYPWTTPASRVVGRFRDCPSWTTSGGRLHWRELAGHMDGTTADIVAAAIPPGDVYVTIDKDVLGEEEAVTNWEQGALPLSRLAAILYAVAGRHRIAGIDVCGDWSEPRMRDPARWFISVTDRTAKTPPANRRDINARSNRALLAILASLRP